MTVLSLGFLPEEYSQIKALLKSLGTSSDEEFEIRFGTLERTFNTNFSQSKFLSIMNNLDFLHIHKRKEQSTDIVEYKGNYRKITLFNGVKYEHKVKGKNIDINIIGEVYEENGSMKGTKSTIRFSSSKEKEINENDWNTGEPVKMTVKRIRTTYFMDNYKVDMTNKIYENKTVFEVEVEFNNDYIKGISTDEKGFFTFMGELKTVLSFVYSSSTIYSEYYFNLIVKEINSIKYPVDIRPKNIADEDVLNTKLQGYAVTNKLDGVGYNITFIKISLSGVELIILVAYNSTDIFSISTIKSGSLLQEEKNIIKSFSKAEIILSTKLTQVHFFDNLLYGIERTYEKDLYYRLNKAIEINNICIKYFSSSSIPVSYEVKMFEIPSGDIIDSIKNVINRMSDRYDVFDLVNYNDGIIFQPLGTYTAALKWKFPSKVTIDFLLRKDYENDKLITYKLCSKVKPGTFVQFKDNITNIEHSITVCKTEMFDGILGMNLEEKVVEIGIHNNEWSIHRIRFDKVPEKTNHIKTAQSTFVDILYQFTLPYLEKLIKYSRGEGEKPTKDKLYLKHNVKEQKQEIIVENLKDYFPEGNGYVVIDKLKNKKMSMKRNEDILKFIKDVIKGLKYTQKGIIDINPLTGSTSMVLKNFFDNVYTVKSNDEEINNVLETNLTLSQKNIYTIEEYENIHNYNANILFLNYMFEESTNLDFILDKFPTVLIIVASNKTLPYEASYFKSIDGMKLYAFYNPRKPLENLRVFANTVKKDMIEETRNKVVVDIGSGVGGDIFKYSKSQPKELFLIEPSDDNIKSLNIRLKEGEKYLRKLNYKVLKSGGEETQKIYSFVNKKVDYVNMFFSLTFFFKSREMLMSLVNTIDYLLKDGGVFMGTVMDGYLVEKELYNGDITNKDYEIKKRWTEEGLYNKEISIDFKNTVTATYQTEYLVYMKEFEFLLASKGIILEKIMNFNDYNDTQSLTPEEKFLNGLYSLFSFRKSGSLRNNKIRFVPIHKNKQLVNEYWYSHPSPADGSCLFHSVVMNLLGDEASPKVAYDIRNVLSKTLTLNEYTNLQDGNLAIINLHEILLRKISLSCFTQAPYTDEQTLKNKVEKIIEKYSSYRIPEFRREFINELVSEGFSKEEVEEVFKGFYLSTYLSFSENLANPNFWADQSIILLLAEKLKINIVLISSRTLEAYNYNIGRERYNEDYISIVLLYIDDTHFEPLCKKNNPYEDKCQYTFSLDELKTII